jgi:hypothetical protein
MRAMALDEELRQSATSVFSADTRRAGFVVSAMSNGLPVHADATPPGEL